MVRRVFGGKLARSLRSLRPIAAASGVSAPCVSRWVPFGGLGFRKSSGAVLWARPRGCLPPVLRGGCLWAAARYPFSAHLAVDVLLGRGAGLGVCDQRARGSRVDGAF